MCKNHCWQQYLPYFDFGLITGIIGELYFISGMLHIEAIEHIEFKIIDNFTDILIFHKQRHSSLKYINITLIYF